MVSIKSALVTLAMATTALAGVRCESNDLEANKDEIQQAIDELHSRGTELCTVPAGQLNKGFAHVGNSMINGLHNDGSTEEEESSWCGHIADAAQEVLDQCGEGKDTVAGSNEAYGNGNLLANIIWRGAGVEE